MLQDQVAIVSGIGPGMGRDISLALARAGANIVLAARSEPKMREVQQEIEDLGRKAISVVTDIGSSDDCQRLVERAIEAFGRIDILVNNAYSLGDMLPFENTDIDSTWQQVLNVNLLGYMRLSQAVVPQMKKQGRGSIVMISSVLQAANGRLCFFKGRFAECLHVSGGRVGEIRNTRQYGKAGLYRR
jgi:NAD(P)-dependent dehydrogenase (short-subunit alcohol dehydrogenase family)